MSIGIDFIFPRIRLHHLLPYELVVKRKSNQHRKTKQKKNYVYLLNIHGTRKILIVES